MRRLSEKVHKIPWVQVEIIRHHLVKEGWDYYRGVAGSGLWTGNVVSGWVDYGGFNRKGFQSWIPRGDVCAIVGDWDFAEFELEYKDVRGAIENLGQIKWRNYCA